MTPTASASGEILLEKIETPSLTFNIDTNNNVIIGEIDELEAVKQASFLCLNTDRFYHLIYSWNYGNELVNVFGKPYGLAIPEIKRFITEALCQDDRISSVDSWQFTRIKRGVLLAEFIVHSKYGSFEMEKEVAV